MLSARKNLSELAVEVWLIEERWEVLLNLKNANEWSE
jgi:hypothetical protein